MSKNGSWNQVGGQGRLFGWKKRSRSKSPAKGSKMAKYVTKASLPKQVMTIVNQRAELKHFFHEFKSQTADNTGTVYHLSQFDDGTLDKERVGENVMICGVDVSGFFNCDEANETVIARLIVFRANEAVASTPSPGSILTTIGDVRTPVSLYQVDNIDIGVGGYKNRGKPAYTIFYDKIIPVGDEGGNETKKVFNVRVRLRTPLPCQFIGNEDTDEGPGQWYMMWCSSNTSPATTCQLNADARIYYTDV